MRNPLIEASREVASHLRARRKIRRACTRFGQCVLRGIADRVQLCEQTALSDPHRGQCSHCRLGTRTINAQIQFAQGLRQVRAHRIHAGDDLSHHRIDWPSNLPGHCRDSLRLGRTAQGGANLFGHDVIGQGSDHAGG